MRCVYLHKGNSRESKDPANVPLTDLELQEIQGGRGWGSSKVKSRRSGERALYKNEQGSLM